MRRLGRLRRRSASSGESSARSSGASSGESSASSSGSDKTRGASSGVQLRASSSARGIDMSSQSGSEDDDEKPSKNANKRYGIAPHRRMLLTVEDIMFFGLSFAGFGEERQRVRESLNVDRFKAHFGPEPRTVKDILYDLKESLGSSIIYKDVMMAMNWLKLCKYRGRLSRCCAMVNFRGRSPPPRLIRRRIGRPAVPPAPRRRLPPKVTLLLTRAFPSYQYQ